MELADLSVFRAVVQAGGVTRAAERLHRVQSNVTTRVKKLEEELGTPLFAREGRKMQLTPSGQLLLDYAERILALVEEAREALCDGTPRGTLRLGAMESTAAIRLPAPLALLHRRHPQLAVELHTGDARQMTGLLLRGELDAALVAEPVSDARLTTRPCYDEPLVIVTSATHPPVKKPRDLQSGTLLVFHVGCPHRQRLEQWCARGRWMPQRLVEVASYHAILGCAVAGMGAALMPRAVVDGYAERERLGVHPISGPFGHVRILLVWRRDAPQAKVALLIEALEMSQSPDPAIFGKSSASKTQSTQAS